MIRKNNPFSTTISPGMGIGLIACMFIFMSVITSVIVSFLTSHMSNAIAAMRISIVLQDLLVFILPALGTALFMTRLPAQFLDIETLPGLIPSLLALAILLVSTPLLNNIIQWNENIHLPESMAGIEAQMRAMEDSVAKTMESVITPTSPHALILSILIVGVLAGLSEELFFRGAIQKLLLLTRMNHHVAIWLTAFIFSAVHFQFFGFVPRMILGAYFGYLVWWTRCLWIPIIVHAVNNSIVVISKWNSTDGATDSLIETIGTADDGPNLLVMGVSFLLTVALVVLLKKNPR